MNQNSSNGFGTPRLVTQSTKGEAEHIAECAKKTSKTARKRKEGTEDLDATDERTDADRWDDVHDMMNED